MSVVTEFVSALKGHKWQISCLEFKAAAGTVLLASGSWDKQVRIWDLSRIETSTRLKGVHEGPITSLAWCRKTKGENNLIATTSADNTACLWDYTTGKHLVRLSGHTAWVLDCSFSSDGRTLATGSWDTNIKLWDVQTEKCVRTLSDHESGVWTCKYQSENPNVVCSGSEDGSLRVWDARSTTSKYFGGHDDSVRCCSWSKNGGEYLASGSADSKIILWDFRQNVALTKCCGHEATVSDVKFYPVMGRKRYPLLLSCGDYTTRMWHPLLASSKELIKLKQHNFGAEVEALAISDDGTLLATGGLDNQIILTAIEVPFGKLEDMPVSNGNEQWSRSKSKEKDKDNVDGVDECDGLPHKDAGQGERGELTRKKEHLITPDVTSAAGVLEDALVRRDNRAGMLSSSSSNEQPIKKPGKQRKKGARTRPRPKSYVASNGTKINSNLNMELSKKLASLKHVKPRAGSDPLSIDVGKSGGRSKSKYLDPSRAEIEAVTDEMFNLVKELEKTDVYENPL